MNSVYKFNLYKEQLLIKGNYLKFPWVPFIYRFECNLNKIFNNSPSLIGCALCETYRKRRAIKDLTLIRLRKSHPKRESTGCRKTIKYRSRHWDGMCVFVVGECNSLHVHDNFQKVTLRNSASCGRCFLLHG